ncbi:MAG: CPBP family intramembrane metalloprotease [Flavobacterium sp.]|nr:CPBP family intramembrane metalloprotease [Flavobacterium sp.]
MNEEIKSAIIKALPFAIILFILFIATKQKKIDIVDLGIKKPSSIKHYLFWAIGFLIFILLTEFSLSKLGFLEIDKWHHSLFPSIIRILGALILAPIAEEFIFRGLLLSKLINNKLNLHFAILIQACIFVLLHNFTYQNTFSSNIGIAQSLIDGSLFGYARYYTKSIYTPITMHIIGNIIATSERFLL